MQKRTFYKDHHEELTMSTPLSHQGEHNTPYYLKCDYLQSLYPSVNKENYYNEAIDTIPGHLLNTTTQCATRLQANDA